MCCYRTRIKFGMVTNCITTHHPTVDYFPITAKHPVFHSLRIYTAALVWKKEITIYSTATMVHCLVNRKRIQTQLRTGKCHACKWTPGGAVRSLLRQKFSFTSAPTCGNACFMFREVFIISVLIQLWSCNYGWVLWQTSHHEVIVTLHNLSRLIDLITSCH